MRPTSARRPDGMINVKHPLVTDAKWAERGLRSVLSTSSRPCKDCGSTTRPTPYPGPRCATCHRAFKKRSKTNTHDKYVCRTYGLQPGEYAALKEMQGGKCYICQRATGASRQLSVEHSHDCCPELPACGGCIRCLACRPCNDALGHWNTVEKLARAAQVLAFHPAQAMLAQIRREREDDTA